MEEEFHESHYDAEWRRPAPRARALAMGLFGWGEARGATLFALVPALAFAAASILAPALISLGSTASVIAPIADARALAAGATRIDALGAPLYSLLLLLGSELADSPGRAHLIAKGLAAAVIAVQASMLLSARLPSLAAIVITAALSAYAAAPFSGPSEFALALMLTTAAALSCPPNRANSAKAIADGVLIGLGAASLWFLDPLMAFALAPIAVLGAFHGKSSLVSAISAAVLFCLVAASIDVFSRGFNESRLVLALPRVVTASPTEMASAGSLGVSATAAIVIFCAAVFGGREQWRSWASGVAVALCGAGAAYFARTYAAPALFVASAIAVFSIPSPFYNGVFRNHDRASVSLALASGALALFWAGAATLSVGGQLAFQINAASDAPADIRAELGLIQPGGRTLAQWVAEGRVAAASAREAFAMAPADQSAVLLDGARRAREIAGHGVGVAILTGADAACVIAEGRPCAADGPRAARESEIVLVPRLDLDRATAEAKARAEVLLYTDFRLAEQTDLWDVWVRRNASLPSDLSKRFAPSR